MTWVPIPDGSLFPPSNLPYGVFSMGDRDAARVGVAIGDHILDLAAVAAAGNHQHGPAFATGSLNAFLALGRPVWSQTRAWVRELLSDESHRASVEPHLLRRDAVRLHLPFEVGDYVDFYSSQHHAENLSRILRPENPALPAAWRHLPIGYHGRAGTVVVSGTDIVRPSGQHKAPNESTPTYGPSQRLDIEAEVGFVVGTPSRLGEPIPVDGFADHVFGVVLVNDWSARDIQAFEYVPLGPFLGKSFATSVSPWVVPLDALAAARVSPPARDPEPLPYLRDSPGDPWGLDLNLEVTWNGTVVSRPPFAGMYWTPAQQLAHLTANGASVRTGDLFASGTVSGPARDQRGSLIELTWNGADPVRLADGGPRAFLEDGDTVTISGWAPGVDGVRIGLGEVTGTVRSARR